MLYTSQPGVSRQIRELEDELGVTIFARAGKRLTGLTGPGQTLLPIVERLLQEAGNEKTPAHREGGQAQSRRSAKETTATVSASHLACGLG